MRVEPLGETAVIVRQIGCPGYRFAAELRKLSLDGVVDIVPSFDTVGVVFEPDVVPLESLAAAIKGIGEKQPGEDDNGILHRIPVCYELGDDLEWACEQMQMSREQFIQRHSGVPYRCYAVGFVPGFAYLGYLPGEIAGLARKPQPRTRVPKGSVGIAGRQTGVYPTDCPGGWQLIGWTPTEITDAAGSSFLIAPGDEVEFYPVSRVEVGR